MAPENTGTAPTRNQLAIALLRYEFDNSDRRMFWSRTLSLLVVAVSLASLFVTIPVEWKSAAAATACLGGLLLAGALFWLDRSARSTRDFAERARRLTFHHEAQGTEMSDDLWRDLLAQSGVDSSSLMAQVDIAYFRDQKSSVGPVRLGEQLRESCFYTRENLKTAARSAGFWVLVPVSLVVLVIAALLEFLPAHGSAIPSSLSKAFPLVVGALVSRDFIGLWLDYSAGERALDLVWHRLQAARRNNFPGEETMLIQGDYDAIVAAAPVVPNAVYRRNRDRLAKLWEQGN